ncbi:MAG: hypothetical protein D6689_06590 [Deltaproteobacteria bacterium]|nr:MAG: hypothetical protein D6689_06590 [Deltaproteobacteria bacterium]
MSDDTSTTAPMRGPPPAARPTTESPDRFDIRRKLGAGGMGVVYEAFDRLHRRTVALKTLRRLDGPALYRFKQEFRSLADTAHPNLVSLYELICVGGEWLFTMELVRGVHFLDHVRRDAGGASEQDVSTAALPVARRDDFATAETTPLQALGGPPVRPSPADIDRLRPALRQLCEAVGHLHRIGRLHRDIKPSNVLVECETDRVVVCDFGLVAELTERNTYQTASDRLVGTVSYMSPEQAAGRPLTEASDWYSVGVVLYHALTGRLPLAGDRRAILELKQSMEPVPPSALVAGVPDDLDRLCVDLLRIDPAARPPGTEVLRRLGAQHGSIRGRDGGRRRPFVGRERERARLAEALDRTRDGRPVAALVHGVSGAGKTALATRFADEAARAGALVLRGRCYPNEFVPFKALDGVIDDLSSHLARQPDTAVAALLPPDTAELARLFPVLRRVGAIAEPERPRFGTPDAHELRRVAVGALRALLRRLCDARPVIVFVDDMQWGDRDSAALLDDLLTPADAPPLLLLGTYRDDVADDRPLVDALTAMHRAGRLEVDDIALGPLSDRESAELVRALQPDADADALAREAGGNPLLLDELVRHAATGDASRAGAALTVDAMIARRFRALDAGSRTALALAAVFGRPAPLPLLADAAGDAVDVAAAAVRLEADRLLRRAGAAHDLRVECYHDRVREAVLHVLSGDELRDYHRRIALALQRAAGADDEALVEHWLAAGDPARAAAAAVPAAERAAAALAFERAARLYGVALAHLPRDARWFELRERHADALADAGFGVDAAAAYLEAAGAASSAARALALEQRAALAYLTSGHLDEGVAVLDRVMARVGYRIPATARGAVLSIVTGRARLAVTALRWRLRDESQLSPEQLARIEVCWTAAVGLGMVDPLRGFDQQTRHLALAAKAGEPRRLLRALALEIAYRSTSRRGRRAVASLLEKMEPIVTAANDEVMSALVHGSRAFAGYQAGEFARTRAHLDAALATFRHSAVGRWEISTAELYRLWTLYYLGDIAEAHARAAELRREAARRGDAYSTANVSTGLAAIAALIATGDPNGMEELVRAGLAGWPRETFHLQHWWEANALAHRDLYVGDPEAALAKTAALHRPMKAAYQLRVGIIRVEFRHQRARAAIAAARKASQRDALLRRARRDARAIARDDVVPLRALGALVDAEILAVRGDGGAAAAFERAARACADADLHLFAACANYRLGELIAGDDGARRKAAAEAWMREHGVADPARTADMLAPV